MMCMRDRKARARALQPCHCPVGPPGPTHAKEFHILRSDEMLALRQRIFTKASPAHPCIQ